MWHNLAARVVMSPLTDGTTDINEDKCPELECVACWSFGVFFVPGFVVTFPHYFAFIKTASSRMTVSDAHISLLIQLVLEVPSYTKSYWPKRKRRISVWQKTCWQNNKKHPILMSNLGRSVCLGHVWWSDGSGEWKCTAVGAWDATSGVTMATVSQERASWQSNLVKIINVGVCLCLIYVCARVLLSPGWWGETEFYLSRLSASVFIIITHKLKIKRIGTQLEGIYGIWLQHVKRQEGEKNRRKTLRK